MKIFGFITKRIEKAQERMILDDAIHYQYILLSSILRQLRIFTKASKEDYVREIIALTIAEERESHKLALLLMERDAL